MSFDPYHKWLGIPPKEQPPHHYRLLGLGLYEADADVIDAAANRQMAYVQSCATGKHLEESQKLLNELSAARLCLLTPQKKQEYDAELRRKLDKAVLKAVPVVAPPALSASTSKASSVAAQPRKTANSSPSSKLIPISLIVVAGGLGILVGKIVLDKLRPADEQAVVQLNDGDQNESALSTTGSKPLNKTSVTSTSTTSIRQEISPTPTSTSSPLQAATALKSEATTVLSAATATASKPPMPVSGATSQAQNTSPPPNALPTATSPAQVATAAPIPTPLSMPTASPTPKAQPSISVTPPKQLVASTAKLSPVTPSAQPKAGGGNITLKQRLSGTRWLNSNGWLYIWDADAQLIRKLKDGSGSGFRVEWHGLGPNRISVTVKDGSEQTLVFDKNWQSFQLFGEKGKEIGSGRRVK